MHHHGSHHGHHHDGYGQHPGLSRPVVHVMATITEVGADTHTHEWHQHIYATVTQVLDNPNNTEVAPAQRVHVAIQFGDSNGLPAAVPGFAPGQDVELRGVYVSLAQAYAAPNGEHLPVIHFTHHPLGYVIYHGVRYQ